MLEMFQLWRFSEGGFYSYFCRFKSSRRGTNVMTSKYEKYRENLNPEKQAALEKLNARVRTELAKLQGPEVREKIEAIFAAEGKIKGKRPKAGSSY